MHTAGAFGEEDKVITDREGIEPVVPVAKDGTFTPPVDDYAGLHVFEANLAIIDHLRAMTKGVGETGSVTPGTVLLRRESYEHSYPHCWRCREPLIYMAVSSWFVSTTKIRDRMLDLNQQIRWVPEHVKDGQFGKWLENTRDWSISRNRFWGARSRSGAATTRRTPASTSTARSTSSSATSAYAPTTCTGRSSTS